MINLENINKPYKEGFSKPYNGNDREECPICSDNDSFTYKSWVRLGCSHFFHKHCIDLWIEERPDCPTCPLCTENVYKQQYLESSNSIRCAFIIFLIFALIIPIIIKSL